MKRHLVFPAAFLCFLLSWGCSSPKVDNAVRTPIREYPQFRHIELSYCDYCVTADQVRRHEDRLGSKALDMSGLEIAQAFNYFDHESKDTSGNYYSWRVIGSMVDCSPQQIC